MTAGKLLAGAAALAALVVGAGLVMRPSGGEVEASISTEEERAGSPTEGGDEATATRLFPKGGVTSILGMAGEYEFDIITGSLDAEWNGRLELGPAMGHDLPWMLRNLRLASEVGESDEEEAPRGTTARADAAATSDEPESTIGWTVLLEDGVTITEFDPITETFSDAGAFEGPIALTHLGPDWLVQIAPVDP